MGDDALKNSDFQRVKQCLQGYKKFQLVFNLHSSNFYMGQCDEQKVAEEKVVVNDKFFIFQNKLMKDVFLK